MRMQGSECAGVDLNRNFDSHWSEVSIVSSSTVEQWPLKRGHPL